MNSEDYCRDKATPPGSNLYYSLLYQAKRNKRTLYAFFAFEYELQQIIATNTDPGVTRIKLQWWLDEINKVYTRKSQHPIGIELEKIIGQWQLDKSLFIDCICAVELHIQDTVFEDYQSWGNMLGKSKALLWQNAAVLCECKDPESPNIAKNIGQNIALVDVLQHIPRYIERGLCPLPQEEMGQHGITATTLQENTSQESTRALFSNLITPIQTDLKKLQSEIPRSDRHSLLFCHVASRLAITLCNEIRNDNYRLLENRIILTPLRKLWLAWRTK